MEPWGAALFGDPCHECGFDWSIKPEDAVGWIAGLGSRLAESTTQANGSERDGKRSWSITEYVCHVGDNLRQWAERVQCARLSRQFEVAGYDPDILAEAREYAALSLAAAAWSTGLAAAAWANVLTAALDEEIELQHATRGAQRAEDIARNNCHDAYHHLWDVSEILKTARRPKFG